MRHPDKFNGDCGNRRWSFARIEQVDSPEGHHGHKANLHVKKRKVAAWRNGTFQLLGGFNETYVTKEHKADYTVDNFQILIPFENMGADRNTDSFRSSECTTSNSIQFNSFQLKQPLLVARNNEQRTIKLYVMVNIYINNDNYDYTPAVRSNNITTTPAQKVAETI